MASLQDAQAFEQFLAPAASAEWVVYAKAPFGGPEQVLECLGRYTLRVAIANSRRWTSSTAALGSVGRTTGTRASPVRHRLRGRFSPTGFFACRTRRDTTLMATACAPRPPGERLSAFKTCVTATSCRSTCCQIADSRVPKVVDHLTTEPSSPANLSRPEKCSYQDVTRQRISHRCGHSDQFRVRPVPAEPCWQTVRPGDVSSPTASETPPLLARRLARTTAHRQGCPHRVATLAAPAR